MPTTRRATTMNITTHEENTYTTTPRNTLARKPEQKPEPRPALKRPPRHNNMQNLEKPHKIRQRKAESAKRSARS
jgi:hypothetical protein